MTKKLPAGELALDGHLTEAVMRRLPIADRAAFGASCRRAQQVWRGYPFSADDYGSAIPHRYLGPEPSREDWLAVIQEKKRATATDPSLGRWKSPEFDYRTDDDALDPENRSVPSGASPVRTLMELS